MIKIVSYFFLVPLAFFIAGSVSADRDKKSDAEKFCITDQASYNVHKAKMPSYFNELPAILGAETKRLFMDVFVFMNIEFKNNTLVLKTDIWKMGSRYQDEVEIVKVCFNPAKKNMNIEFANNNEPLKVSYKEHGITVDGVELARLTPEDRLRIRDRIAAKAAEAASKNDDNRSVPASSEVAK